MSLNMSEFVEPQIHKSVAWLGKHKWVLFDHPDDRWIISTNKRIFDETPSNERDTPKFRAVKSMIFNPYKSDKELLLTYALSRCLATGPKLFQPTSMQCCALENTGCNVPFEQYAQPYETLLIKFPEEYRLLKKQTGMNRCPKYVISWYDRNLDMIMVACQFDSLNDRIVGILNVKANQTIEDVLVMPAYYESDGTVAEDIEDFKIAQLFERIAINLNMLMMYGGSKLVVSHHNKAAWQHYRELKKKYEKQRNKARLAELRDWHIGEIDEIIMDREIGFRVQTSETPAPTFTGNAHRSPEPHWRRGHWTNQPFGVKNSLRKPVLRPPVWVVGQAYKNIEVNLEETSVIYKQEGQHWEGRPQ